MTRLYSNVVSAGETEIEKALAFSRRAPVATAKGRGEAGRAAGNDGRGSMLIQFVHNHPALIHCLLNLALNSHLS